MAIRPIIGTLLAVSLGLPALAAPAAKPVNTPETPAADTSKGTQPPTASGSDSTTSADDHDNADTDSDDQNANNNGDAEDSEPQGPLTFSLNAGGALNTFVLPSVQTKLGFRLPFGERDWEMLLGYGPINNAFFFSSDPSLIHATLGFRWYLVDMRFLQLFLGMTGGYMFSYGADSKGNTPPKPTGTPTVMAGPGISIMPWDHFGMTLAVDVGYPYILRPELNFRVAF